MPGMEEITSEWVYSHIYPDARRPGRAFRGTRTKATKTECMRYETQGVAGLGVAIILLDSFRRAMGLSGEFILTTYS
jgi:hypothetical protein